MTVVLIYNDYILAEKFYSIQSTLLRKFIVTKIAIMSLYFNYSYFLQFFLLILIANVEKIDPCSFSLKLQKSDSQNMKNKLSIYVIKCLVFHNF